MRALLAWLQRLPGLFGATRFDRELADELEGHLELHIDDNLRAGMTPAEARRQARLKLGGVEVAREAYRDRATLPRVAQVARDLNLAARQLRRAPGFGLTAIAVLALGVGASVTIFAFADAALIRPLPYPAPSRLIEATGSVAGIPHANLSHLDYVDWKRRATLLGSLDVHTGAGFLLATPTGSQPVRAARVSSGFFRTLGVSPAVGRDFRMDDELPNAGRTVILSHASWQQRFAGRDDIIGQVLALEGTPYTVIGVLPPDFHFAPRGSPELWTPLDPSGSCELRRSCHNLKGIARLRDDVTPAAALAELSTIAGRLEAEYPESNRGQGASVALLSDVIVGDARPVLRVLLGGAVLLFLIAVVDVSGLIVVRVERRRREFAVRSALGASPAHLTLQLAAEAATLVVVGSGLGVVLASWMMGGLTALVPVGMAREMPYLTMVQLNPRVLTFAVLLSAVAAALFAAIPALRISRAWTREGLSEGGRGSAGRTWRRLGTRLVVVELTVAMILLAGAGLLGKSVYQLLRVDINFNPDDLATMVVAADGRRYRDDGRVVDLGRTVVERLENLPGVISAGITSVLPVSFNGNTDWIRFVGQPYDGEHNEVNLRVVSAGYFTTLQAAVVRGRTFSDADDGSQPRVVVINRALAQRYFGDQDPVGTRIGDTSLSPGSIKEIIGVVDDIREGSLDSEIWPAVYYPFNQSPISTFALVARVERNAAATLPALTAAIRDIDPALAAFDAITMAGHIAGSPSAYLHRSVAWLVAGFAAFAWLLGVVGLYGVLAYLVSQRTREIGIRMALGAAPRSVSRLVVTEAGTLAAVGITAGALCAVAAATWMRTLLFETPPWDVGTLAAVAAGLASSALLASYRPARRAASVNPIEALKRD